MKCEDWHREHHASGSHPWVRFCDLGRTGRYYKASVIKWAEGQWRGTVQRRFGNVPETTHHVYGKTLRAVKAAATRKMQRLEKE